MVELFDVEYYRDLEMRVRGHSRSLKLVPFESLGAGFLFLFPVCEIFSVQSGETWKTGLGFVQGHWKWHHLIDRILYIIIRVPIRLP